MDERTRLGLAIGLGVLGGVGVVSMAVQGMKGGITDDERRGLIAAFVIGIGGYAASQLWQVEKEWWFSAEEAAKKAAEAAMEEWGHPW